MPMQMGDVHATWADTSLLKELIGFIPKRIIEMELKSLSVGIGITTMYKDLAEDQIRLGVVGLGYVGLPLAVEFGKKFKTIGYDLSLGRIQELKSGIDVTKEVDADQLKLAKKLNYTNNVSEIAECNVYIVTVPTPIDLSNRPDLRPLLRASKDIGKILNKGNIVVFESTVYPGATEEKCVQILEENSGLKCNKGFFVGYSPERINPGDKIHKLVSILKLYQSTRSCAVY